MFLLILSSPCKYYLRTHLSLILFASLAKQMLRTKRIFMLFLSFLQHFHMRSQSTIIIKAKWYGISQV